MSRQKLFLAALATALLWWLAMQKLGAFALGWVAFAPLLLAAGEITSPRARFFYGWYAGVLCFALHNWWLLPTITKASVIIGVPSVGGGFLGLLAVLLIALGHGLGVAALTLLWNPRAALFRRAPLCLPIVAALLWLGFEWLRGSGELAHSWGAPAFSQWRDTALLQATPFLGQHGLSALCIWFAAGLALWLRPEYSALFPNLWRIPVVIFALLHFWGGWRIWEYDHAPREKMPVVLVSMNVSSLNKNREGESHFSVAQRLTNEYLQTQVAPRQTQQLIIWPETSASLGAIREGTQQQQILTGLSRDFGVSLLVGAQSFGAAGLLSGAQLTNAAVLFSPDGSTQRNGKMRVVPFGERAPFERILPMLEMLAPRPPVMPATQITPLDVKMREGKTIRAGTLICFESCFSRPAKNLVEQGAQVLFVLTNDEWFAGTTAPWEHAAMFVVRAVENGVPVAQCANGGYSFAVDARGRFLAVPELGRSRAFEVEIPLAARR